MSRSRLKTPIVSHAADSDKVSKRRANRICRREAREALRFGQEFLPTVRDLSDVWNFAKDGRSWFGGELPALARLLRK